MFPRGRLFLQLGGLVALLACPLRAADLPPELAAVRAKAEAGNAVAQYNLGLAYMQGRDIPADLPEAFVWLSLATENGSTGRALDTLVARLTPEQLETGRARLAARRNGKAAPANATAARPATATPPAAAPGEDAAGADKQHLTSELTRARLDAAQAREALRQQMQALTEARAAATEAIQTANSRASEVELLKETVTRLNAAQRTMRPAADFETLETQARAAAEKSAALAAELETTRAALAQARAASAEPSPASTAATQAAEARAASLAAELQSARSLLANATRALEEAQAAAKQAREESGVRAREIDTLRGEIARLEQAVHERPPAPDLTRLEAEKNAAHEQLSKLSAQAQRAADETAREAQLRAAAESKLAGLTQELEQERAARATAQRMNAQLVAENQGHDSVRAQLVAAQRENADLTAKLAAATQALEQRRAERDAATAAAQDSARALAAARERLAALEQEGVRATEKDRAALAASDAVHREATALSSRLEAANATLTQLRAELAAERERVAQLERDAAEKSDAAAKLAQSRAAELAAQLQSANDALAAARRERDAAAQSAAASARELGAARDRLAALERAPAPTPAAEMPAAPAIAAAENIDPAELATLKRQLADTETKLNAALRTYTLQREENARLAAELAAATSPRTAASPGPAEPSAPASTVSSRVTAPPTRPGAMTSPGSAAAPVVESATSPPPAAAPALAARTYTVVPGDTLTKISRRFYGTSDRWPEIYAANMGSFRNANVLRTGLVLKIP
jgi:LysM repeat protein